MFGRKKEKLAKVAVITGGTGGLGKAVCRVFLDANYQVVTTYRDDNELKDLLEFVTDKKSKLSAYRINVTDEASLDELAARLEKKFGYLNDLICLVGGFAVDASGETFDKMMAINAKSFLLTTNALLPLMRKTRKNKKVRRELGEWGSIVAIASRPALEPTKGVGIYAASKAAVVSLVKTLAKELLSESITINAVAPSTIDTAANRKAMPKADFSTWVKPEEIAQTILFLANSKATSGAIVPIYGKA